VKWKHSRNCGDAICHNSEHDEQILMIFLTTTTEFVNTNNLLGKGILGIYPKERNYSKHPRADKLIYTKLWNPLGFIHSKFSLLNFAHAVSLPGTKNFTLYFKSLSFKSNPVFLAHEAQRLSCPMPSNPGRYKFKMTEFLFTWVSNNQSYEKILKTLLKYKIF
jgi:hypothetical protein